MAENPACKEYWERLSPYADGELAPSERAVVERHLGNCKDCTTRVADLRAESGLLRLGLEMRADQVDWSGFSQKVMARVSPKPLPFWEGFRLSWRERFEHQRLALFGSLAAVAAAALVVLQLVLRPPVPEGYAAPRMAVKSVAVDSAAHVAPVVMENDSGDAIIWLVQEPGAQGAHSGEDWEDEDFHPPTPGQDPRGGEL